MAADIKDVLNSMENAMRLQIQANAEKRATKAEQKEPEFKEKLMRAAVSKMELDGKSAGLKGAQDAVRRDQLMLLMMGGIGF